MRAERTIGAKVLGVGRCAEWPNVLEVYFDKAPSDDDLRRIHDLLRSNVKVSALPQPDGD